MIHADFHLHFSDEKKAPHGCKSPLDTYFIKILKYNSQEFTFDVKLFHLMEQNMLAMALCISQNDNLTSVLAWKTTRKIKSDNCYLSKVF